MASCLSIKLILLLLLFEVASAETQWNRPASYNSSMWYSFSPAGSGQWLNALYAIDGDLNTYAYDPTWSPAGANDYIDFNFGSSYVISAINVTIKNGVSGGTGVNITLHNSTGMKKVCDITSTTSKTTFQCLNTGSESWTRVKYTAYPTNTSMYDIQYAITIAPTPEIPAGPCRRFCDYEMVAYPPAPSGSGDRYWKLTLTNTSATSPEGLSYLTNTWTNVKVTISNGTCSNPGRIYNLNRLTTVSPNALLANYTYGDCPPSIDLCFNGTYNTGYTMQQATSDTSTDSSTKDLISDSFKYYHYNITYKDWVSNSIFNFSAYSGAYTDALCKGSYGGFAEQLYPNITVNPTKSYLFQTATSVDFYTRLPNGLYTPHATEDGGFYTIYLLNDSQPYNTYRLELFDYTGNQFWRSRLDVKTAINNTMTVVCSDRFGQDNYIFCPLINNTLYKIVATSVNGDVRDLDQIRCLDIETSCNKIVINNAVIRDSISSYNDIRVGWTQDYVNSQVGVTVWTTLSNAYTNFSVKNASTAPYQRTYSSTARGNVSFIYTNPNVNEPLFVEVYITNTSYGPLYWSKMMLIYNESAPMNQSAFSWPLPTQMLGSNTATWKKLFVVIMTWFILLVAAKAADYGTGAIVGSMFYGLMWYVAWIPHDVVPMWLVALMCLTAVFLKIFERRFV